MLTEHTAQTSVFAVFVKKLSAISAISAGPLKIRGIRVGINFRVFRFFRCSINISAGH